MSRISSRFLAFFLILLVMASFAQTEIEQTIQNQAPTGGLFDILKDWRMFAFGVAIIMVILAAIVYQAAIAFDMPEIKAWAGNELVQAVVTVLILVLFTGVVLFMDGMMATIVNNENLGFTCTTTTSNCAITTADNYLSGMTDMAEQQMTNDLGVVASASKMASMTNGLMTTIFIFPIPLLQLTVSGTFGAGNIMTVDRYGVVVEQLTNILSSMYAQEFFVSEISTKLGPMILALGVIARAFFATRKLGGMLIAIAIGVIYVYPLMYVFDWLTLNVTAFGDSVLGVNTAPCPAICLISAPNIVMTSPQTIQGKEKILAYFNDTLNWGPDNISTDSNGNKESLEDDLSNLESNTTSYPSATINGVTVESCVGSEAYKRLCPIECRELPYPTSDTCMNATTRAYCGLLPAECKISRQVDPSVPDNYSETSPTPALHVCPTKCRTVPPLDPYCNTNMLCMGGLDYCRYARRDNLAWRPDGCPTIDTCPASLTANQSCVWVLPALSDLQGGVCDECVFVPQEYHYDPPSYTACSDVCSASSGGPPKISPAQFAQKTQGGMVGPIEVQSASGLVLPGYVLPLLNIMVTLMFIRSFSQVLGGDIDIPGLTRIL